MHTCQAPPEDSSDSDNEEDIIDGPPFGCQPPPPKRSGTYTVEYMKLKESSEKVIKFLSFNISSERLGGAMFAKSILCEEDYEETCLPIANSKKMRTLIHALLYMVEIDANNYHKFLRILEDAALQDLVDVMEAVDWPPPPPPVAPASALSTGCQSSLPPPKPPALYGEEFYKNALRHQRMLLIEHMPDPRSMLKFNRLACHFTFLEKADMVDERPVIRRRISMIDYLERKFGFRCCPGKSS